MDEDAAAQVSRPVGLEGIQMSAATTRVVEGSGEESWIPTSLLVADDLGVYELDTDAGSTPGLPSGVWRPIERDRPVIVAAHPMPPLPNGMNDWRAGLTWITEQRDTLGPDVIVAGDFNATVDHLNLGRCQDAATEARAAATGTWPSIVPKTGNVRRVKLPPRIAAEVSAGGAHLPARRGGARRGAGGGPRRARWEPDSERYWHGDGTRGHPGNGKIPRSDG